jgi:hypothetical protein
MVATINDGTCIFFGTCTVVEFCFTHLFVPEMNRMTGEDMGISFDIGHHHLQIMHESNTKQAKMVLTPPVEQVYI